MTDKPGTYALILEADSEQDIEVGALGDVAVRTGIYVYVGSAFGPGGLRARVERHARGGGALHWHVDYLRRVTTVETVWYTHDPTRRECLWAKILRDWPASEGPVKGFGASDCNCPAHLARFDNVPSLDDFERRVSGTDGRHAPIRSMPVERPK